MGKYIRIVTLISMVLLFHSGCHLIKPEAKFSMNPGSGDAPLRVNFSNQSSLRFPGFSRYEWDFGDGSPLSGEEHPSHVFEEPGRYVITLTLKSLFYQNVAKAILMVRTPGEGEIVSVDFNLLPQEGVAPLLVNFTDTSMLVGAVVTGRLWDFGDGTTSARLNPTHRYTEEGSYDVTLTLYTEYGSYTHRQANAVTVYGQHQRLSASRELSPASGLDDQGQILVTVHFDGVIREVPTPVMLKEELPEGWRFTRLVEDTMEVEQLQVGEDGNSATFCWSDCPALPFTLSYLIEALDPCADGVLQGRLQLRNTSSLELYHPEDSFLYCEALSVEGEAFEGETPEGEALEGEIFEGETAEGEVIDPQEGEMIEGEAVEGEAVEPVEGEPVEGEEVEPVEGEPVEGEEVEPVEGEPVEGEEVEPVEGEPVEGEEVEPVEGEAVEPVEGEPVEGEEIDPEEGEVIVLPEGEPVEGEPAEGEAVEGEIDPDAPVAVLLKQWVSGDEQYKPGVPVTVQISLSALGRGQAVLANLITVLPADWEFSELNDPSGLINTNWDQARSRLTFNWSSSPVFPFQFSFTVIPAESSEIANLWSRAFFHANGQEEETNVTGTLLRRFQTHLTLEQEDILTGYKPGEVLHVTVNWKKFGPEAPLAFAVVQALPEGWRFAGIVDDTGTPPDIFPESGYDESLEFLWTVVPPVPGSFTYKVLPPASAEGIARILGKAGFRFSGKEQAGALVSTCFPRSAP